ncbi:MAG: PASTA domain-containing protein, partial [Bacilli bacterium]|nr:PASTA domain-containing protein [Bacilli bacterium]
KVRYALESVVSNGTGRTAYIDGYRVGGKTGTAQKVKDGHYLDNNYILSFVGFLPADDPKVVVYFAIDNPKGVQQFGGVIAGPPAKAILTDSIKALNIAKPSGGMEKEYQYTDKKYKNVPDVVGLDKSEAVKKLKNFKVDVEGSGNSVAYQSPEAGSRIYEGETVRIFTN